MTTSRFTRLLAGAALTALLGATAVTGPAHATSMALGANNDSASIATSGLLIVLDNDNLGDGPVALSIAKAPEHGTARVVDDMIEYTADANYTDGFDHIGYRACVNDGQLCFEAVAAVHVLGDQAKDGVVSPIASQVAVNTPTQCHDPLDTTPSINPAYVCATSAFADASEVPPGYTFALGSDAAPAELTLADLGWGEQPGGTISKVRAKDGSLRGTVSVADSDSGQFLRYTPAYGSDEHYSETLTYTACVTDPAGTRGCVDGDVTILASRFAPTQTADDSAPTENPQLAQSFVAASATADISFVTPAAGGSGLVAPEQLSPTNTALDPATVKVVVGPQWGEAIVGADGTVTYFPSRLGRYTDAVTYRACDTDGTCALRTVPVAVVPHAGAGPDVVAVPDTLKVAVGQSVEIPVMANDVFDGDGSALFVKLAGEPKLGTAAVRENRAVAYTAGTTVGTDTLRYRLCEPGVVCGQTVVQVEVVAAMAPKPTPKPTTKVSPKPTTKVLPKQTVTPKPATKVTPPRRTHLPKTGGDEALLALGALSLGLAGAATAVTYRGRSRRH